MRKTTIGVASLLFVVAACGGTDSSGLLDGSTDDTGTGNDGGPVTDTGPGTDGGPVTDTGPGTDSGPTLDASTFDPAKVNGLVLWLEANIGASITQSNQRVTKWADQTSHHNDANGNVNSIAQGRNPTVKNGQINSLDVIHFNKGQANGTGNMLTVPDNADKSLQWGTGDFFVAIVGEFDNDPKDTNGQNFGAGTFFARDVFLSQTSASGVAFYGNIPTTQGIPSSGLLYLTANTLNDFAYTGTAYNDNKPHVFSFGRIGNKIDLYVDGTSVNSATAQTNVDVSNPNTAIRIGADGDANLLRLDGDIGEIYAVAGTLSSSDQTNIQAYLKKKWATP